MVFSKKEKRKNNAIIILLFIYIYISNYIVIENIYSTFIIAIPNIINVIYMID